MKFKKLSLLLLGGILLAGCSKASAIELSVVPNQSMVTGKAIVIDVKTDPVISIDPNSIEISGGESWVENGVIKFKASEPGQYTMKVTQDNVTSNTITIPLNTSSAIAKNETQSTSNSKSSQSTSSKSSTQNNHSKTNQSGTQSPTQNIVPSTPSVPNVSTPSDPTPTPTTPNVEPTPSFPTIEPEPSPEPSVPSAPAEPTPEETPTVEETPVSQPEESPSPDIPAIPAPAPEEEDPASTVQDTSLSVDQVYENQGDLIAHKTPITVDGILPESLVSDGSGKEVQVLWNEDLKEYILLEGFTIPFGGCTAQVSGTLSRNGEGQLVLSMTYISTDDIPKSGDTGYHDVTAQSLNDASVSAIDRNNPTPHPEPGTGQ